jgi:predicted nucleotidyltransferase component of viral defense system
MVDINRHRLHLVQILREIYSDVQLANSLGFKGGTALMFFYGLPWFSVDLDFDLISDGEEKIVFGKVREILLKYGTIYDEALKHFGPVIVLDYGTGERKLKVEISNRILGSSYEVKNLLGINMRVMVLPDMFSHKLCALLDRGAIAGRDIFDCWFFLKNRTPLNRSIVETRMKIELEEYLQSCIDRLETVKDSTILRGMGELMDNKMKQFVRSKLRAETIEYLRFYKEYPILK